MGDHGDDLMILSEAEVRGAMEELAVAESAGHLSPDHSKLAWKAIAVTLDMRPEIQDEYFDRAKCRQFFIFCILQVMDN